MCALILILIRIWRKERIRFFFFFTDVGSTEENIKLEKEEKAVVEKEYDSVYKYNVPNYLKPDPTKFYLVVDSVEGLRQLISKFGSHENDLEIITRSTKSV